MRIEILALIWCVLLSLLSIHCDAVIYTHFGGPPKPRIFYHIKEFSGYGAVRIARPYFLDYLKTGVLNVDVNEIRLSSTPSIPWNRQPAWRPPTTTTRSWWPSSIRQPTEPPPPPPRIQPPLVPTLPQPLPAPVRPSANTPPWSPWWAPLPARGSVLKPMPPPTPPPTTTRPPPPPPPPKPWIMPTPIPLSPVNDNIVEITEMVDDEDSGPNCQQHIGGTCIRGVRISSHSSCLAPSKKELWNDNGRQDVFEILSAHNFVRRSDKLSPSPKKQLPLLKWDPDLATTASHWASQCRADHDTFGDRATCRWKNVGQSFFIWWGSPKGYRDAVSAWFSEINDWKYGQDQNDKVTGHFVQLVDQNTTHVGCGKSVCDDNGTYIFCNYGPVLSSLSKPYDI